MMLKWWLLMWKRLLYTVCAIVWPSSICPLSFIRFFWSALTWECTDARLIMKYLAVSLHLSIPSLPSRAPLLAIIPVHVDDSSIVWNWCTWIIAELHAEIVDMSSPTTRDRPHLGFCVESLETWNLSNCALASTPITTKPYLLDPSSQSLYWN